MHPWLRYVPRMIGGLAFLGMGLWLAPQLGALAELAPSTKAMLATTKEILVETQALHEAAGEVQQSLAQVHRQELLLEEKETLIRALLEQLAAQEQTAVRAQRGLEALLAIERQTVTLAHRANQAGQGTLATLHANAAELARLERASGRIEVSGQALERQTQGLLTEMELATDSFAVLGRLKAGASQTVDRSQGLWDRVKGWLGF